MTSKQINKWADDPLEMQRRHKRMRKVRGKAKDHACVDCQRSALDWSMKKGTDGSDPQENYEPRCRSCHVKYDYTDERRKKIGDSNRGKKRTEEQKRALSEAHMGNSPDEAHRKKLSDALKGKPWSEARRVAQNGKTNV